MTTKASHVSDEAATAMDERGQLTLLSLPDVPLLRVLALLSIKDLVAAGLASARLRALTRAHRPLWMGKARNKVYFRNADDVLELLRVCPPVDTLSLMDKDLSMDEERFMIKFKRSVIKLEFIGDREGALTVSQKVWQTLKTLHVSGATPSTLFPRLKGAHCLETLRLIEWLTIDENQDSSSSLWPQGVVLPRLHSLELDLSPGDSGDVGVRRLLGSLLLAHRGQLRYVKLGSLLQLPLVRFLPADLHRLELKKAFGEALNPPPERAESGDGGPGVLQRLTGLKELRITSCYMASVLFMPGFKGDEEAEYLLRSCSSPLERLELEHCYRDQTLRLLGGGGFASLQHLRLSWLKPHKTPRDLKAALAGLPRLRALVVVDVPLPQMFRDLSPDAIPALELLVVAGDVRCAAEYDVRGMEYVAELSPTLQDLVRRAPKPLHALLCLPHGEMMDCAKPRSGRRRLEPKSRLFTAHPAAEACGLCAEALAAGADLSYDPVKVSRVQVR